MLLAPLVFTFCKIAQRNRAVEIPQNFDWQGHRGCRGLRPENTVAAFLHALDFPEIRTLELDLAVSKDRQLIVSHEPWFNPAICHLPSGDTIPARDAEKQLIFEKTVAEIRAFDCGSWGNPRFPEQVKMPAFKPTFRETVEVVRGISRGKSIRWNIEIKTEAAWDGIRTPPVQEFAQLVVDEIRALKLEKLCNVQSFDVRALRAVRALAPELPLSYLVEPSLTGGQDSTFQKLGFTPEIFSPYYLTLSRSGIERCHAAGVKVIPWTVNDTASMRQLLRLGVDGIITDYPNRIAEVPK